jgi:hypothetical protein
MSQWTYILELGRTARVLQRNPIFTNRPQLLFRYSRVALVEIELIIGLLSIFEVIEPQGNYMEELYGPGEYKLIWMPCCYFSYRAYIFCIYQACIFCNSHEIHFETTGNSLL